MCANCSCASSSDRPSSDITSCCISRRCIRIEPRSSLVEYNPADNLLTYWYSGQAPHMMQAVLSKHLGIPEENVRLVARDVGGSFGIKIHTYGDDIATAAAAMLLKRPVKFIADRFESFQSDIHARDHVVKARAAFGLFLLAAAALAFQRLSAHLGDRVQPDPQSDRRAL